MMKGNTMMKMIGVGVVMALSSGCALMSEKTQLDAPMTAGEQQVEESVVQLTYFNSAVFDEGVSNHMSVPNRYIIVDFPDKFTLNSIPERIDGWLRGVSASNNNVELEPIDPDEQDRSVIALAEPIISMLYQAYITKSNASSQVLAQNYSARVYYMKDTGVVQKILFYPAAQ